MAPLRILSIRAFRVSPAGLGVLAAVDGFELLSVCNIGGGGGGIAAIIGGGGGGGGGGAAAGAGTGYKHLKHSDFMLEM